MALRFSIWTKRAVLFLGPLLFFTTLTENPYSVQIALIEVGVCLAIILDIVAFLHRGHLSLRRTPLDLPLLALGGALVTSTTVSYLSHPTFFRPGLENAGLKALTLTASGAWGVFFLATQSIPEERALSRKLIYVGTTLAALYGLSQFYGWDPLWGKMSAFGHRPISTFGNPNFLSTALVLVLPMGFHYVQTSTTPRGALFAALLVLAHTATLLATLTRSSWMGAMAGLAIYFFLRRAPNNNDKKRFWRLCTALALLIALWPWISGERGISVGSHTRALWEGVTGHAIYASWHQRLLIGVSALDLWRDAPWLGKGWGSFEVFFPFAQARWLALPALENLRTHANNAHQIFLEFAAQTGVVGLGLFLWTGVVACVLAWRHRRGGPLPGAGPALAGLAGVFGAIVDNALGNVSLFFAGPALLVFWTLGQSVSDLHPESQTIRRSLRSAGIAVALIGAAVGVMTLAVGRFAADLIHFRGRHALEKRDALQAARAFERASLWANDVRFGFDLGNLRAEKAKEAARLGLPLETRERARAAVAAYTSAQRANPGYDEVPLNRAHQWELLGDSAAAFRDRRYALLINPAHPETVARVMGSPLLDILPWDEKENLFQSALRFHARAAYVWRRWAEQLERASRRDEAAAAYERVLRLDLDDTAAWKGVDRTAPAGASPDLKEARALLRLLRKETPDTPARRTRALARVLVLRGLVPDCPMPLLIHADLLALIGDRGGAEPLYRAFLSVEPTHENARKNLAHLLQSTGRQEEAAVILSQGKTP